MRGLQVLDREFPTEAWRAESVDRAAENSLHAIEHREQLSRVYLDLVTAGRFSAAVPETSREDVAHMRQRANQFTWQPDGDVVLLFTDCGENIRIVPDAVVTSIKRQIRLFVECDRSTKTLKRIRDDLKSYDQYYKRSYREEFPDGCKPALVYVVRSEARRATVQKVRDGLFLSCHFRILVAGQASAWCEQLLIDPKLIEPNEPSPKLLLGDLWRASRDLYDWLNLGRDLELFKHEKEKKLQALHQQLTRCVAHVG
jgi:hypothetical protein